jgi:hypothetical protein
LRFEGLRQTLAGPVVVKHCHFCSSKFVGRDA